MAKLAASEAAHKAADKAMQILASAGYRRGSVVERLFRDVRATEIYQGTSEAQRMIIAANVLANAESGDWQSVTSNRIGQLVAVQFGPRLPDGGCHEEMNRREFVQTTTAAGAAAASFPRHSSVKRRR